jgi:hypothetical protein
MSNNEDDDSFFPQIDLLATTNQPENRQAGNTLSGNDDSVYVLPKTYNGKTVTELFPEFNYDSILRFSKIFGVGRQSSLPKIWKGTRKRKKNKTNNENELNAAGTSSNADGKFRRFESQISNDVFKLFESDLTTNQTSDQTNLVLTSEDKENELLNQQKEAEVVDEDELEFETDDEVNKFS